VPLATFVVLTTIGCALWAAAFVLAGLLAGDAWGKVSSVAGRVLLGVGVVVVVASLSRRQRRG
jgi:membrane protein DedA with SNARE-associated domain